MYLIINSLKIENFLENIIFDFSEWAQLFTLKAFNFIPYIYYSLYSLLTLSTLGTFNFKYFFYPGIIAFMRTLIAPALLGFSMV